MTGFLEVIKYHYINLYQYLNICKRYRQFIRGRHPDAGRIRRREQSPRPTDYRRSIPRISTPPGSPPSTRTPAIRLWTAHAVSWWRLT